MDDFRNIFRLSRGAAEVLLQHLMQCNAYQVRHTGRTQIDAHKQLLLALKYFGHQEGHRSLSQLFGVSVSSINRIVERFCDGVMELAAEFIKWPSIHEQASIARGFAEKSNLPELCIGAIDCRENPILKPSQNPEGYFNRKNFYSIKIQAVCDSDTRYLDVEVGWPGKSHDGRAFRNSHIFQRLQNGHDLREDCFLIGDSAYPNKTFILAPYKDCGNLNSVRKNFNQQHSRARQVIECAFGRTVERFRRLKFLHVLTIHDGIRRCIVACTLHNFCLRQNESDFMESSPEEASPHFTIFTDDVNGSQKRDAIAASMMS